MISVGSIIAFFFLAADSAAIPAYYYYKDANTVEVIRINEDKSYECYRESKIRHVPPFYSQGYYLSDGATYMLRPGIVDSLGLSVKEQRLAGKEETVFLASKIKIATANNLWQLIYFNYDHLNRVQYDKDIRLCVENSYGTRFYKRLNTETMDFGEIISEGPPAALYIVSGQYVVTKKYLVKDASSNYFEVSVGRNELFNLFKDFYMANHSLRKKGDQLEDTVTGRVYTPLSSPGNSGNIRQIARSMR